MRFIWLTIGLIALALGILGIPLPLLPTVPFLLLAAFCFAKSSVRLHVWLISHATLGPPIRDWEERGAISRSAKVTASIMMAGSLGITFYLGASAVVALLQIGVLCCVATFIWSRPEA